MQLYRLVRAGGAAALDDVTSFFVQQGEEGSLTFRAGGRVYRARQLQTESWDVGRYCAAQRWKRTEAVAGCQPGLLGQQANQMA